MKQKVDNQTKRVIPNIFYYGNIEFVWKSLPTVGTAVSTAGIAPRHLGEPTAGVARAAGRAVLAAGKAATGVTRADHLISWLSKKMIQFKILYFTQLVNS